MFMLDCCFLIVFVVIVVFVFGVVLVVLVIFVVECVYGLVDLFIGIGGEGYIYLGVMVLFGMVQFSLDMCIQLCEKVYGWVVGYCYDDSSIVGFLYMYFFGIGYFDLGDILLMLFIGNFGLECGDLEKLCSGYVLWFCYVDEKVELGYYVVILDDYKVCVELIISVCVGVYCYVFFKGIDVKVLLDMCISMYDYLGKVLWLWVWVCVDGIVIGFCEIRGWVLGCQLFFVMCFLCLLVGYELYNIEQDIVYKGFLLLGEKDLVQCVQIEGCQLVGMFVFGKFDVLLVVKVVILLVSEVGVIVNFDVEVVDFDFDCVCVQVKQEWMQVLFVLDIDVLEYVWCSVYIVLYYMMLGLMLFMDVDGQYRGLDNVVYKVDGFMYYLMFLLWDIYCVLYLLLMLVQLEKCNSDFVNLMLVYYEYSLYGMLLVWLFYGLEDWCMIGYYVVLVIVDVYVKGICGFDVDKVLKVMVEIVNYGFYDGIVQYCELGYVLIDEEGEVVSKMLEYVFDDWIIVCMVQVMGKVDIVVIFDKCVGNWCNVFDKDIGFMCVCKCDGSFCMLFDFSVSGYGIDYIEGNVWQYLWYVLQDVVGLVVVYGGSDKLFVCLDEVFNVKVDLLIFEYMEDIMGLIGWYVYGNEFSYYVVYLYLYVGQLWCMQVCLKQIMDIQYVDCFDGLVGNDDVGQMLVWYVFIVLGFYLVVLGLGEYIFGCLFLLKIVM